MKNLFIFRPVQEYSGGRLLISATTIEEAIAEGIKKGYQIGRTEEEAEALDLPDHISYWNYPRILEFEKAYSVIDEIGVQDFLYAE